MAFGDTPQHGQDKCATCTNLVDVKGVRFKEYIRYCGSMGDDVQLPPIVTSCNMYRRKNTQSLHEMHMIAWVLTLDQKKRTVGFVPPKQDESDEDTEAKMWEAGRSIDG